MSKAEEVHKTEFVKSLSKGYETQKVLWLEGKAPDQHNPEPLKIEGTITAPSIFVEKRKTTIDPLTAHALVSVFDGTIKLVVNEKDTVMKCTVEGKIKESKRFLELGINNPEKSLEPIKLSQKFRLLRTLFKKASDHSTLVSALRNLEVNVTATVNERDDLRGNLKSAVDVTVKTSIPETFTLNIPLFEGQEPQEIEVFIFFEVKGTGIMCYLESIDAADLMEEIKTHLISQEVDKIIDHVTVMFH